MPQDETVAQITEKFAPAVAATEARIEAISQGIGAPMAACVAEKAFSEQLNRNSSAGPVHEATVC